MVVSGGRKQIITARRIHSVCLFHVSYSGRAAHSALREVALMENMEKKDEIPSLDQHLKGREYLLFVQEQDIFTQKSINNKYLSKH